MGEVKKPGAIQLPTERKLTVLEAITLAGGFTDIAAPDRTKVLRNANGQNQSIEVKISRITKEGDKSADIFLAEVYVPKHNARFAVAPENNTNVHRPLLKSHCLEEILSLRTERTIAND